MFAMLAPLFAGSVASTGIMSLAASKIALTAGGALVDTAIAKNKAKSANAAQQAAYEKQLAQDEKNRALAKEDASNKFSDMSAAARKAGFNPLTVLRATGGAGFGSYGGYSAIAPVLSKFNFAQTFAQKAAKSFYDQKINEPIDKYNKEIRDLELQQRKIDLKLGQQLLRRGNGTLSGGGSGGARPTLDAAPNVKDILDTAKLVDPKRGAEAAPVVSSAGISVIDHPILGKIFVPGNDGDPWGIDELMTAVIAAPYSIAATKLGRLYPKEADAPKDGTVNLGSRLRERLRLSREYNPEFGKLSWPSGFGGGGFAPSM